MKTKKISSRLTIVQPHRLLQAMVGALLSDRTGECVEDGALLHNTLAGGVGGAGVAEHVPAKLCSGLHGGSSGFCKILVS
jgi:hypothetical protein